MRKHLDTISHHISLYKKILFFGMLVIQFVGLALIGNGLYQFFMYDLSNDWRLPYIWFASVGVSLVAIYVTLSNLVLNLRALSVAFILEILMFLVILSCIIIVSITTIKFSDTLKYCYSDHNEKAGTCIPFFGQLFCEKHITTECQSLHRGFSLIIGGECAMALISILFLFTTFLKMNPPSFSSDPQYEPLLQSVDIQ
ncbi:hypothetical protein PPL_06808 [Heterostelium album PN500]|uniref:Uncharacterized protein n=1 Tax=Heterostelium pallidum (strain ATCC 26659 / Pp 5 / PN500) TaxID=670386 RepID=D3BDK6_HETP5|nr:hypothetical protein PPL_06808 [Heterostelium album PN500]EFA79987.1 hypothetical protein PPL_06808 [Heterostelium album PN500]|eukprot:XP_020432107.1 hypothetical protein PPL_06808 [Heterostelium album PN500]